MSTDSILLKTLQNIVDLPEARSTAFAAKVLAMAAIREFGDTSIQANLSREQIAIEALEHVFECTQRYTCTVCQNYRNSLNLP